MKRQIIKIDESLCNGCGNCIPGCPEGALRVIDGKARLVSDLFCDGLGACIGECPPGAITVEEREVEPYDERRVMSNIIKMGPGTIKAHLDHLKHHDESELLKEAVSFLRKHSIPVPPGYGEPARVRPLQVFTGGCPGSMERDLSHGKKASPSETAEAGPSELTQWPVQLQLINPRAPYFRNADLLIAADCVPFSFSGFHQRFLKGMKLVIFCPKLDTDIEHYIEKLAEIFSIQEIHSVSIVHMEVPCCFGVGRIAGEAIRRAGADVPVKDFTISVQGDVL